MLKCYKFVQSSFVPAEENEAVFFDLQKPDADEIRALADRLDVPLHFLSDPMDPKERPRIEQEGIYTLVILRVALFGETPLDRGQQSSLKVRKHVHSTVPLGIIFSKDTLITVSWRKGMVQELLGRLTRRPYPKCPKSAAFKIFIETASDFINQLERLEEITDRAEATLSRAQQNEEIMALLSVDKILIHYTVALKSNRNIMERLMDPHVVKLDPDETDVLERALTENQQAIYMADIFGQVLGSMSDAFGTIISNNLNKVVKFLTGITIVLMLPTFIVGAYGMNVVLPLEKHPAAFWIILGLCLLSCGALLKFFTSKKWV
ncbi:MAG: magnesium transporter CorA family protein [Deltaproteobacteria bacterium]|jgi:magnesium transporter|nr:magnesium transporter CorA family protein [Deltaproteobacteria bacterium]